MLIIINGKKKGDYRTNFEFNAKQNIQYKRRDKENKNKCILVIIIITYYIIIYAWMPSVKRQLSNPIRLDYKCCISYYKYCYTFYQAVLHWPSLEHRVA